LLLHLWETSQVKVVFLDLDGVLNRGAGHFRPENVKWLNRITDRTKAHIVIHSSWRYSRTVEELRRILRAVGVSGEIIDVAPVPHNAVRGESGIIVLDPEDFEQFTRGLPTTHNYERPASIQRWLDGHQDVGPSDFVILDDTGFMAHFGHRHIRTRQSIGLTREHADQAIRMLLE